LFLIVTNYEAYYTVWIFHRSFSKVFFYIYSFFFLFITFIVIDTYLLCWRIISGALMMLLVVLLVSGSVIVYSLDYISLYSYPIFFLYITLFQFSMLGIVLCNDLVISFLFWELVGVTSYLLINFWSNKNQCGIKAVVYNKLGDCFFLFGILVGFNFLRTFDFDLSIFFIYFFITNFSFTVILISFFIALSTKSAQFPFSSWLIYAMSAPTPISALLHSSTMVIAGVYLGLISSVHILFMFYPSSILLLSFASFSMLFSSFLGFWITDMKSIIAYSTISQIGYMLLAAILVPRFSIYHIVCHAFFKSLLFILSAEIIHNSQANWQSIYTLKIKTAIDKAFFRGYFIIVSLGLMFSVSKEGILNNLLISRSVSSFLFMISILGALFTTFYTLLFLFFPLVDMISGRKSSTFYTLALTSLVLDKLIYWRSPIPYLHIVYTWLFHLSFTVLISLLILFVLHFR